ncbi:hypothetical protein HDU88_000043 [Geranomyces variabilis]|nr:hypothetical protein HDU88_000043 [Geranomyces variabilis]
MDDIVKLNVGGREFLAGQSSLTIKSPYFATLLGGGFSHQLVNDHIFIDADPDMFGHILRYLRRLQYPLFYKNGEFDIALYAQLRAEAEFFGLERLEKWIRYKGFVSAVEVERFFSESLELVPEEITPPGVKKYKDLDSLPADVRLESSAKVSRTITRWCAKSEDYGQTKEAPCIAHYHTFAKATIDFDRLKEK